MIRGEYGSRWVIRRIGKGVEFVGIDRVVSGCLGEIIVNRGIGWRVKIGVIFGVVDGLIVAPFNNKAPVLEERLTVVEGKSVDPGDGGVWDGKLGPTMPGDTGAGGEGEEMERALGITGGTDGDGTHGAGVWGVGGIVVVKNLGVSSKLDTHGVEIGARLAGDDSGGAEGVRDAGWPGELVETADNIGDHVADEKFGEAAVWEAMSARAEALFDGANGTFDLTDVTICCNNVEVYRGESKAGAFEFLIPVNVDDLKTADGIKVDGCLKLVNDGFCRSVGDGGNGTETNVAGDRVEETEFLDKKKSTQRVTLRWCVRTGGGSGTARKEGA